MAQDRNLHIMFILLFVGYLFIVYVRQSVSFAAPVIAEQEKLSNSDLGLIVSSQQLGYTFFKFIGGTLADVVDPGLTLVGCLLLTGITSALFTTVSSVAYFSAIWFLCGMAQGPSWSACAVLLKQNFPADQFATWWSILSTSSNVAGTAGPFASQLIVSNYGWRASLLTGVTVCIVVGIACFTFFTTRKSMHSKTTDKSKKSEKSMNLRALLNPLLMLICLNYLLVSVTRGACSDWGQMYLIKNKGQSLLAGSSFISSLELGGIVGSIITGYISDALVSKDHSPALPRLKIIVALTMMQMLGLYCFIFHSNSETSQWWTNLSSCLTGFGMYGTISLLGVSSMETAPENLAGTAHSMATLGGNLGRVVAGYPLSVIATWMSWHESFLVVFLVSVVSIVVSLVCLWLLQSKEVGDRAEAKRKV